MTYFINDEQEQSDIFKTKEDFIRFYESLVLDANGNPSRLKKKKYLTDEIKQYILDHTPFVTKDYECWDERYYCIKNNIRPKKCDSGCCNNQVPLKSFIKGYEAKYCSYDCKDSDIEYRKNLSEKQKDPDLIKTKREKFTKTLLERYGVEHALQIQSAKDKAKQTNAERWSGGHYMRDPNNTDRMSKERLLVEISKKKQVWEGKVTPLFSDEEYTGWKEELPFRCNKCNNEFTSPSLYGNMIPRCMICYPYSMSTGHSELKEYIESLGFSVTVNDRQIIKPQEIDLIVDGTNICFEFNGSFFHQTFEEDSVVTPNKLKRSKPKTFHLDKTIAANEKGYRLYHIMETDWFNKKDIVKSKVKSLLGLSQKIHGRKCKIVNVSNEDCKDFLNNNHISGNINAKVKLGLLYNNELVMVATFSKPRFNKKYEYELIRLCSKIDTNIIGGAKKLIDYFMKSNNVKSLITYADISFSGLSPFYEKIGFKKISQSKPSYIWVKRKLTYTRYQTQKQHLKDILGDKYDPNMTEDDNMYSNGFFKIYDCGTISYELNL